MFSHTLSLFCSISISFRRTQLSQKTFYFCCFSIHFDPCAAWAISRIDTTKRRKTKATAQNTFCCALFVFVLWPPHNILALSAANTHTHTPSPLNGFQKRIVVCVCARKRKRESERKQELACSILTLFLFSLLDVFLVPDSARNKHKKFTQNLLKKAAKKKHKVEMKRKVKPKCGWKRATEKKKIKSGYYRLTSLVDLQRPRSSMFSAFSRSIWNYRIHAHTNTHTLAGEACANTKQELA